MLIKERLLGFCSVYAPNLSLARVRIWEWMASSLSDAEWIIGSEFHMVEWEGYRGGGAGTVVSGLEKLAWLRCKATLQLFSLH